MPNTEEIEQFSKDEELFKLRRLMQDVEPLLDDILTYSIKHSTISTAKDIKEKLAIIKEKR